MNLSNLFKAALNNKRATQWSDDDLRNLLELHRKHSYHNVYRPGASVQMSDRSYTVGRNGNFVRD